MRASFKKALENIIHYGDTDIFPFPFERHLFEDKFQESLDILDKIHKDLTSALSAFPPLTIESLSQVGYYGFRKATLIEPFWNAYFLGLVISIADKIEAMRIPEKDEVVFSYHYKWDDEKKTLFNNTTWIDYKRKCIELSNQYDCVLQTDISNFYDRINHHKLENALKRVVDPRSDIPSRIIELLGVFSNTISYGLPVGGPAARILAELALNQSDFNLKSRKIVFCRYADDYTIFCNSESDGYNALLTLCEKLSNDQLALQKGKTKIISSEEFRDIHQFLDPKPVDDKNSDDEQKLLNISVRFDPYSPTAEEDYEHLKEAIQKIDIIGILSKEVNKSVIDQTVTKQAINAIKALNPYQQASAVQILLDHNNLATLSPVFTTIMRSVRSIYNDLDTASKHLIDASLMKLFEEDNYLIKIELNINYIIQVLSVRPSQEKTELFVHLYDNTSNNLIKRQIIITLSNWNCDFWLSDIRKHFATMTIWERRAFIYGSFFLRDEGKHWREHNKKNMSQEELLVRDWCSERKDVDKPILV